jgi:hypothetical protein
MNSEKFFYTKEDVDQLIHYLFVTRNEKNRYKMQDISLDWFLDIFNFNTVANNYYSHIKFRLYHADPDEIELVDYLSILAYISDESNFSRVEHKNIITMFLFIVKFQKNINIYSSIIQKFIVKLKSFSSALLFNLKWIIVAALISVIYFIVSLYYIQIDLTKQTALWYLFAILYYLLMSTFNSFLIKYKYGKFTSAIQRFWKRTGMVFWLIEGFLFLLFFYYFLNSSQEPLYMFDYSALNQELLIQLKTTYKNILLLSLAIYLSFILIYNLNYLLFSQSITILLVILLIVFYSLYVESYQFVYVISLFADKNWLFEDSSQSWMLDMEQNGMRVKQQYFVYCLIAKYWHFIFIFISWFFFFIKSLESKKITYTTLGYNTQNLLILYVLNIMCLIQWLKYSSKKFLEVTYYWFHIQYDEKFFNHAFMELFHIWRNIFSSNFSLLEAIEDFIIKSAEMFYSDILDLWKLL